MLGGQAYGDVISISSENLSMTNNEISNVTTGQSLIVVNVNANLTAISNNISHAEANFNVIELDGSLVTFKANKLASVQGDTAIQLGSNVGELDLARNAFIDVAVEFYVKTKSQYLSGDGILSIGGNFWSTVSFHELNGKTYDSFYDAGE